MNAKHKPDPDPAPTETPALATEPAPAHAHAFPIVGIGASAGGLAAFEAFFSGLPAESDPGMAFVLVQHLAPDHASILRELVQRSTRMQVQEVQDGMVVKVNCVYVIPPNRDMAFLHGALHLLEPAAPRGHRLPVDFLFRSLAQDQHERAIGIVLSGTGSDGTQGVRAIKGGGGMVMAQNPASTEFDGMPRSALATGLVDFELPPAEMAIQLIAYAARIFGKGLRTDAVEQPKTDSALKKILVLVRAQTGHDFSQYKLSTINRRIERRMAVHQLDAIASYVKFLQQTPAEVDDLFRDLLIGVTNFFRDPEAFKTLEEQAIPKLFEGKSAENVVRAWVPGCSTGEEAYSIAILLQERLEKLKSGFKVQIFATDIDSRAIATARAGLYPADIVGDITPERLARFFIAEPGGSVYRVHKTIRDMLIFSEHNVVKDAPFSRVDLVSCRNLLIYMGSELQMKLISLFHYALAPGGLLFLGTSESVGEYANLFAPMDRKAKLFQRKEDFQGAKRAALGRFLENTKPGLKDTTASPSSFKSATTGKSTLRELTEQTLLQQIAPVGALVNGQGDILYLHGRTGTYLEPAPGDAGINNILRMARDGLKRELTLALHKAALSRDSVRTVDLRVKTNGHFTRVNLSVCPAVTTTSSALESPLFLVMLEEALVPEPVPAQALVAPLALQPGATPKHSAGTAQIAEPDGHANKQIAELRDQLRAKEEYLHAANEELETSNEELKSSNEEMQSVNEELQSTNEEMETSKEELQSINEELATVNAEMQAKVVDLSRVNNDMNNLLAGTGIGTIFVDHQLRILRFTPAVTQLINLILSDVGRPVGHIVSNMVGYDELVNDVHWVLKTLAPKEVDVQIADGKFFTLRILPYRTLDNVIEGAVITFVEVTEMVHAREALREANNLLRLAVVVRDAYDAITVQDLDGRIIAWNPGAVRMYGWSEAEALAMNVRDRIPADMREESVARVRQLADAVTLEPYQTVRLTQGGKRLAVTLTSTALINEFGRTYAIATTERLAPDHDGA